MAKDKFKAVINKADKALSEAPPLLRRFLGVALVGFFEQAISMPL